MSEVTSHQGEGGKGLLFALSLNVPLWAYPLAGGVGNLAAFLSWGAGVAWLLLTMIALVGVTHMKSPSRKPPAALRWVLRWSWYAGIVWVVYHGAFALAALHTAVVIFLWILAKAQKAVREAEE
ncbi:hypothetical protein QC589_01555 [Halomonas elongata]|uniref:hypothetical protein n=1 Tax=Halomonas elongata TaxID=2746 RepID=UPI00335F205B